MDVREKLVELLQDKNNPVWRWFPNNASMMQLADYLVSNGVTIAVAVAKCVTIDAVPMVRCKDCKYHEDEEIGMVYCPNAFGGWVGENWFCADGERKEGAD